LERIALGALWLLAMVYVLNQVRKPDRWLGRFFLWIMNNSHSEITDWGLSRVRIEKQFSILDVGCGGGRTIQKLAALAPEGIVHGVDYAEGSVAASRNTNARLIKMGRVEIRCASVSQLPFSDNSFDLVTAVETQYYWPDLIKDMQEVLRVLKPGGTLIVILESYEQGTRNRLQKPIMKLLKSTTLNVDEHRSVFSVAGYSDIQIHEENAKGWLCCTGRKPL
jgi:ubiquinone/menaquinone biosynthesis C-methylase UbiE